MKEGMKVLAAYDGSAESHNALVQAADLTKKFKGELTVLNVYWDPKEDAYRGIVEGVENIPLGDEGSLRILDDVEPILKEKKVKYELRFWLPTLPELSQDDFVSPPSDVPQYIQEFPDDDVIFPVSVADG